MKTLDEWAAEQCGVEITRAKTFGYPETKTWFYFEWTLQDARCREIVREHFKIQTLATAISGSMNKPVAWCSVSAELAIQGDITDTIAKAELACIQAIREAS